MKILMQMLLAIILGCVAGFMLQGSEGGAAAGVVREVGFVGRLFMRMLKMLIVPLVLSSVIASIGSLGGMSGFGRMGARTVGLYLLSTFAAASVGLLMVNLIQPGFVNGQPNEQIRKVFEVVGEEAPKAQQDRFSDSQQNLAADWHQLFEKMVPSNVIEAATDNGQLLGLIVFSIALGLAMMKLPGEKGRSLQEVVSGFHEAMVMMTSWVMKLAPIGVFCLLVPIVAKTGGEVFQQLGKYMLTVFLALFVHFTVILPLFLKTIGRLSPWQHFLAMREALVMAFATASSAATLPVTMRCVRDKAHVSKEVTSFTLPLGATVNMDGTALYECVAVLFVAQVMGVSMEWGAQVIVVLVALMTSIGVAGIPSASLVAILLILKSSNIPNAEVAVLALLAVDRPLDMLRTAVNVYGDSCVAAMVGQADKKRALEEARS